MSVENPLEKENNQEKNPKEDEVGKQLKEMAEKIENNSELKESKEKKEESGFRKFFDRTKRQAFEDAIEIAQDTALEKNNAYAEQMDPRLMMLDKEELEALLESLKGDPEVQSVVKERIDALELLK